ncbi:MAG: cytochrome c maturation protein CcmE [Desulfobacterales bacterium]|nr:cytochrome c maturation protein CcmE [Desulfobacterales bacterium]
MEPKKINKRRKLKPIIISAVILSVIGYLIYAGIRDSGTYYLTVSEVLAKTSQAPNETVRVGGMVAPDSVNWDSKTLNLQFRIADNKSHLAVKYQGVVPDSFKPGREVVVEGKYIPGGHFAATMIMPKCASKYE